MRILFVCLGNICRSPTACAVLRVKLAAAGRTDVKVDSCGTSDEHAGEGADRRSVKHAAARGVDLRAHRARQLTDADFAAFDVLYVMDHSNLRTVQRRCPPEHLHKVKLFLWVLRMREAIAGPAEVPDPWAGGPAGFERVLDIVERACAAVVEDLPKRAV